MIFEAAAEDGVVEIGDAGIDDTDISDVEIDDDEILETRWVERPPDEVAALIADRVERWANEE